MATAAPTTRAGRAERAGQKSGARAGKHVDARRADNYSPPPPALFALKPRVPEVEPFIHTYGAFNGQDALATDLLVPPRGAPIGARFDAERAQHAVDFIQRLYYFEGRWAGNHFRLCHWQERLVRYVFGWVIPFVDGDGDAMLTPDGEQVWVRLIRQVYLEVPRKNGKSTFSAALALLLAYADNEAAPQVFFAAADKDQASIAYGMARALVETDEELAERSVIYNSTKKILIPEDRGELRALSSETKKLYGLNLHGLVFDELMAQPNRVLWDALTTAQGSRLQPLIIAITTAGWDRTSVAFEQREYARQIASGALADPTFLGVCYTVDEKDDWTSPDTWKRAAPSMGETVDLTYYERKCNEAIGQPSAQNSFRTLMLCQWVGQSKRIIPMPDWDWCAEQPVPELQGMRCFGGLDLSKTTDMTALVLDFVLPNGRHAWVPKIWVPEDSLRDRGLRDHAPYETWVEQGHLHLSPGTVIDYDQTVKPALREYAEMYDLVDVSYDRWGATQLASELEDDGFTMVKVGQGFATMSPPTKELVRLIVAHQLIPSDNAVLTWMADNAGGETDSAENLKFSKTRSASRIDGLVAGVMALDGAMRRGRKRVSIYEERGPEDMWSNDG
jgi:phage terminase large subunit-like protein